MADRSDDIVAAYQDVEAWLLREVARAVARGADGTAGHYQSRLGEVQALLTRADQRLAVLEEGLEDLIAETLGSGWEQGAVQAVASVPSGVPPSLPTGAVEALAAETAAALASQRPTILRSVQDSYRRVVQQVTTRAVVSGASIDTIMQDALNAFANRGITSFTDRAGRTFGIDTYTRMALRTARNRALNEGRRESFQANGVQLIQTSWHEAPAPVCEPYQGRILSLDGMAGDRTVIDRVTGEEITVHVTATLEEAEANGYHHPNAILGGDQEYQSIGGSLAGSVGTYRGPAIAIRTAQGNKVTVSPHHPVLTARGWVTAESVCEGDTLFRPEPIDGSPALGVRGPHVDDVPTTVEQEFISLKEVLPHSSIPAAGHNFNDDRQFLEGEVHVVVPDDGLPVVPDTHVIEETGEVRFVWSGVEGLSGSGYCPEPLGSLGVGGSVGGSLSNLDAYGPEPADQGRPGDSEVVSEVLAGVPGFVHTDEVVHIDRFLFEGHAYDFQTGSGMYVLQGIITHNCAHVDTAYIPGQPVPKPPEVDPDDYEQSQRQRQIERHIRHWKRRGMVAVTPQAEAKARAKVRAWQAAQRRHVKAHGHLRRNYSRERVFPGNSA